jgi:hypothetical protein
LRVVVFFGLSSAFGSALASSALPARGSEAFRRGERFGFASSALRALVTRDSAASGAGASVIVMWQVRFLMRATRPRARARQR